MLQDLNIVPLVCGIPDVDCCFNELLKAGRTAPVCAQTLLYRGHEVLQVLCEVFVLVAKQVNLEHRVVDLRTVLSPGHSLPDPQHLHCSVVTGVHQVEEMLHKVLAQEDWQLPGKALVVPKNDIQNHEEAINGAGVRQGDFDVQGGAWYGLAPCPYGEDATPWQDRPPEGAVLLIIISDGGTDFLKQRLGPAETHWQDLTKLYGEESWSCVKFGLLHLCIRTVFIRNATQPRLIITSRALTGPLSRYYNGKGPISQLIFKSANVATARNLPFKTQIVCSVWNQRLEVFGVVHNTESTLHSSLNFFMSSVRFKATSLARIFSCTF